MRRLPAWVAIAVVCALPQKAQSAFFDGNKLYEMCSNTSQLGQSICVSYILGAVDSLDDRKAYARLMLSTIDVPDSIKKNLSKETFNAVDFHQKSLRVLNNICSPSGTTGIQLKDIIIKYLRDNPAERHRSWSLIVEMALENAFPCQ